jgi:uncharacterized repeat protein (TIGR01451 family)
MKYWTTALGLGLVLVCLVTWLASNAIGQPDKDPQPPGLPGAPAQAPLFPQIPSMQTDGNRAPPPVNDSGPSLNPIPGQVQELPGSAVPTPRTPTSPVVPAQYTGDERPAGGNREIGVENGPGQTNENPTGRQEPSVSLEWIGPPTVKLRQPVTYQIILKNTSANAVQQVVVYTRLSPRLFLKEDLWPGSWARSSRARSGALICRCYPNKKGTWPARP